MKQRLTSGILPLLLSLVFGVSEGFAHPAMDLVTAGSLDSQLGQHSVTFLKDEIDSNLYYAVPHHISVVKENGKPLFRMSVNEDGTGDIFLVAELKAAPGMERDFSAIQEEHPEARVAFIPLTSGTFKVALQADDNLYQIISESNVVENASTQSHMPLHAKISREGMEKLRLITATPAGSLLTFNFEFSFMAKQIGNSYEFRINKNNLLNQFKEDDTFRSALKSSMNLDQDWARKQIFKAIGFNFSGGKSIIPLNNLDDDPQYLYIATQVLQGLIPELFFGPIPSNWLEYAHIRKLSVMEPFSPADEVVEVSRVPSSTFVLSKAQASGNLRGVCIKNASLIYDYSGTTSCSAMIPKGNVTPPPSPVFDPILF